MVEIPTAPLSRAMVSVHCALSSETWNVVATLVAHAADAQLHRVLLGCGGDPEELMHALLAMTTPRHISEEAGL